MHRSTSWLAALVLLVPATAAQAGAQTIQNPTLRRAQQAFDNLDYRQALSLAQASLRERLSGFERGRAYELLGFTYSGIDSILKAVEAFKQVLLIEPERDLDPNRTSPKALSAFQVALTQILVVRQLRVDSITFIGGQGAVPIRYTVTQPSRVVTRITGGAGALASMRIDSTVANGQVNIRWPAVPPKSWKPLGLALVYTGAAWAGTSALSHGDLGSPSTREVAVIGAGVALAGFVMTLKKPAPQPARGNILYNQLLRDQITRRNAEIAQENTRRRQQVALTVVPLPRTGAVR